MSEALSSYSHLKRINQEWLEARKLGSPPSAISGSSGRIRVFARRTSQRIRVMAPYRYCATESAGGGCGTGGTPQMADAQGGRGGVGMSSPFPCLDGEQLGSVAGLHVIQAPVKVSLLG